MVDCLETKQKRQTADLGLGGGGARGGGLFGNKAAEQFHCVIKAARV